MNYTEEYFKNCDEETMWHLYNNQYDQEQGIPAIDMIEEEGNFVFKIYCYGNYCFPHKYLCRVFENPRSMFDN